MFYIWCYIAFMSPIVAVMVIHSILSIRAYNKKAKPEDRIEDKKVDEILEFTNLNSRIWRLSGGDGQ